MLQGFKTCFKCGQNKHKSDFYTHKGMADGHLGKCKECTKRDVRQHREANIEYYQSYDRTRNMLPSRVKARLAYQRTQTGQRAVRNAHVRYRHKYPSKYAARTLLGNAVRDGKIEKPKQCSLCSHKGRIHGHHEDYYKPLDVVWLCETCHKQLHRSV